MFYSSPIGMIEYQLDDSVLTFLKLHPGQKGKGQHNNDVLCQELDEYFSGKRKQFTVNVRQHLTPFQKQVLDFTSTIPYC